MFTCMSEYNNVTCCGILRTYNHDLLYKTINYVIDSNIKILAIYETEAEQNVKSVLKISTRPLAYDQ